MSKKMKWHLGGLFLAAISLAALSGYHESSQERAAVQGPNPESIYNTLDVSEWRVIFRDPDTGLPPRVGVTVLVREAGGLLCRKTSPVVPEPVPHFQCYIQLTLSSDQALALFQLLNVGVVEVSYIDPLTGMPRLGVTVLEKATNDLICQSVAPVVPEPEATYTCYSEIEDDTLRLHMRHRDRDRRERTDD